MKANAVYKRAYNRCLAILATRPLGEWAYSEAEIGEMLEVSRTTVRAVLGALAKAQVLTTEGSRRVLRRAPTGPDYFPEVETETVAQAVERQFLQWVLQSDRRPGDVVNASELARQFNTSTTAVREYLTRFSHYGLLQRRENSGWIFMGVTPEFANELYEIREMFELRSARRFIELPPEAPAWAELMTIEHEHQILLSEIDERSGDFSRLDERFHRLINEASRNRFIQDFYDIIALIFHYHYQWNKSDEKERNIAALKEHLEYIAALRTCDLKLVEAKCRAHLHTVRTTFMNSLQSNN